MAKYRVPTLEHFSWQEPVLDKDLNATPSAPSKGDRYIVASGVSSGDDWAGHENDIAWYDGSVWQFDTPSEGWQCYVLDEDRNYKFNGSAWEAEDAGGDMKKSVYDTDNDGIVDKAENLDDGEGNASTAEDVRDHLDSTDNPHSVGVEDLGLASGTTASDIDDAVDKAHDQNTDTKLDEGGANEVSASEVKDAVDKAHDQNTDTKLDEGGANEISASEAKDAYDKRAQYDSDLGVIFFDNL